VVDIIKIKQKSDKIILTQIKNFDLKQIFSCGQAFRFYEEENGYAGVAFDKVIYLTQEGSSVTIYNTDLNDFNKIWQNFFDLSTDYNTIRQKLSFDPVMIKAMEFGSGIRILKQDLWESLITFILSQQNNIPRIRGIVARLCNEYGKKIFYNDKVYYTFPTAEDIIKSPIKRLETIRAGFRCSYIYDAAMRCANGDFSLEKLTLLPTDEARKYLMTLKGVGPKVADCVLLFGAGKLDAFPVDVWMKRVIGTLYDKQSFKPELFGSYSGIAQQYLFYYGRENKIGKHIK
jgi:N-glycosylase/DNA lyase